MQPQALEKIINDLEIVQINLMRQRRDHNGQVLQHDDIDAIQTTIDILLNLIKDNTYIWHKITKN